MAFLIGGPISESRPYSAIALTIGVVLSLVRGAQALFDTGLEAVGFFVGKILLSRRRFVQIGIAVIGLLATGKLIQHHPAWFIAATGVLGAVSVVTASGAGFLSAPRVVTAPVKAYTLLSTCVWGWDRGWIWSIAAVLVTQRAWRWLLEGMTIRAAELLQKERDLQAREVFAAVSEGSPKAGSLPRFAVYLRPFSVTGRIRPSDGAAIAAANGADILQIYDPDSGKLQETTVPIIVTETGIAEGQTVFEHVLELEETIAQALSGLGVLMALGQPGESWGAGRLPVSERIWKETVAKLIESASLCLVIPSANPGTLWEVEYLASRGHLGKTCIIMPGARDTFTYAAEWAAAREAMRDIVPLPPYHEDGAVMRGETIRLPGPAPSTVPSTPASSLALVIQWLFPELPKWRTQESGNFFKFGVRFRFDVTTRRGTHSG